MRGGYSGEMGFACKGNRLLAIINKWHVAIILIVFCAALKPLSDEAGGDKSGREMNNVTLVGTPGRP
jgi:hypothetical protein